MYKGYETAELWRLYTQLKATAPQSSMFTQILKELARREMA